MRRFAIVSEAKKSKNVLWKSKSYCRLCNYNDFLLLKTTNILKTYEKTDEV